MLESQSGMSKLMGRPLRLLSAGDLKRGTRVASCSAVGYENALVMFHRQPP